MSKTEKKKDPAKDRQSTVDEVLEMYDKFSAETADLNRKTLAEKIVESSAAIQAELVKEVRRIINIEIANKKQEYLNWVDTVNLKFYHLWEISRVGLLTQRFLPVEKRTCTRPRLVPPDQGVFAIDDMECAKHFKLFSKTFLPEEKE